MHIAEQLYTRNYIYRNLNIIGASSRSSSRPGRLPGRDASAVSRANMSDRLTDIWGKHDRQNVNRWRSKSQGNSSAIASIVVSIAINANHPAFLFSRPMQSTHDLLASIHTAKLCRITLMHEYTITSLQINIYPMCTFTYLLPLIIYNYLNLLESILYCYDITGCNYLVSLIWSRQPHYIAWLSHANIAYYTCVSTNNLILSSTYNKTILVLFSIYLVLLRLISQTI